MPLSLFEMVVLFVMIVLVALVVTFVMPVIPVAFDVTVTDPDGTSHLTVVATVP